MRYATGASAIDNNSLDEEYPMTKLIFTVDIVLILAAPEVLYLGFTDYMFPGAGFELTNFNNYDDPAGAGSHAIEINASYSGPESVPLSISVNVFVHNVMDNPIYFELGYSVPVGDVGLDLFVGGAVGDGAAYYGAVKDDGTPKTFDIVNTGIKASKEIKITDSFSLPIFGSIIVNPATEDLFYVVGFSL